MIIEINDLPKNQKIKSIEFSVVFDDSDTIEWKEYGLPTTNTKTPMPSVNPPKPTGPENEVIKESLFSGVKEPDQRAQEPIPPEMQDLEL